MLISVLSLSEINIVISLFGLLLSLIVNDDAVPFSDKFNVDGEITNAKLLSLSSLRNVKLSPGSNELLP